MTSVEERLFGAVAEKIYLFLLYLPDFIARFLFFATVQSFEHCYPLLYLVVRVIWSLFFPQEGICQMPISIEHFKSVLGERFRLMFPSPCWNDYEKNNECGFAVKCSSPSEANANNSFDTPEKPDVLKILDIKCLLANFEGKRTTSWNKETQPRAACGIFKDINTLLEEGSSIFPGLGKFNINRC